MSDLSDKIARHHVIYVTADTPTVTRIDDAPQATVYRGCTCVCGWESNDTRQAVHHIITETMSAVWPEAHRDGYNTARDDILSGAFVGGPNYEAVALSPVGKKIRLEALRAAHEALPPGSPERRAIYDLF